MSTDGDKFLEQYLAGGSALSRRYRAAGGDAGPPSHIDERVRAAARRELNARPAHLGRRRLAWTTPLAAAAVMVLAVGVTLHMVQRPGTVSRDATPPPVEDEAAERSGPPEPAAGSRSGIRDAQNRELPRATGALGTGPWMRERSARQPELGAQGSTADEAPEPSAWLNRIRELSAQGNTEAARDELVRFVERYPEHEIPAELAALLEDDDAGAGGQ